MTLAPITEPESVHLDDLCRELAQRADATDRTQSWPAEQLRLCGEAGVYGWFQPQEWGGLGWSDEQVVRGYLALSAACLTTTFIITQRTGACRRIASGENEALKERVLPALACGDAFATVGISHLTTSRRHLASPPLKATRYEHGYRLDGFSPWVTGGPHADWILTGGVVMEGETPTQQQILVLVPTDLPGVSTPAPAELVGLSASHTGEVRFDQVEVPDEWLVAGPVEEVMLAGRASRPGGHETSTLAIGLATAAIDYLQEQSSQRSELSLPAAALASEVDNLRAALLALAAGEPVCTTESLRQRANSVVLRATQAALSAAKGTGYVVGHPAGRWCREALFFLVWSCPQGVAHAHLCELAGIVD